MSLPRVIIEALFFLILREPRRRGSPWKPYDLTQSGPPRRWRVGRTSCSTPDRARRRVPSYMATAADGSRCGREPPPSRPGASLRHRLRVSGEFGPCERLSSVKNGITTRSNNLRCHKAAGEALSEIGEAFASCAVIAVSAVGFLAVRSPTSSAGVRKGLAFRQRHGGRLFISLYGRQVGRIFRE